MGVLCCGECGVDCFDVGFMYVLWNLCWIVVVFGDGVGIDGVYGGQCGQEVLCLWIVVVFMVGVVVCVIFVGYQCLYEMVWVMYVVGLFNDFDYGFGMQFGGVMNVVVIVCYQYCQFMIFVWYMQVCVQGCEQMYVVCFMIVMVGQYIGWCYGFVEIVG